MIDRHRDYRNVYNTTGRVKLLHGFTELLLKTIFFPTMVAWKVVSCNRSFATNFGIGEALRVFDPASKTRNAKMAAMLFSHFH